MRTDKQWRHAFCFSIHNKICGLIRPSNLKVSIFTLSGFFSTINCIHNRPNMRQLLDSLWRGSALCNELQFKSHNLNRIPYILIDSVLGLLLIYYFPKDLNLARTFWNSLHLSIEQLEMLIAWLTQNPAGLKLNDALNTFLSNFFLYHINLWRTYITALEHSYTSWLVVVSAFSGLSILLAFIADFLRVLTVHIFCFHIYTHRWVGYLIIFWL